MSHLRKGLFGLALSATMPSFTFAIPASLETELDDRHVRLVEEVRRSEVLIRSAPSVDGDSPWVTVDDNSQPVTTYTPSATVVDGSTSWQDPAPHDLTASVYTWTTWAVKSTSTGPPPNPTATGKNAVGAFSRCYNMDGDDAPFCRPFQNSTLFTGNTYYITWDPDFYNKTSGNTTYDIAVRVDWYNGTSQKYQKLDTFPRSPSYFGFWPFKIEDKYIHGRDSTNVTLTLLRSPNGSAETTPSDSKLHLVLSRPEFEHAPEVKLPHGHTLTIALPVVFGSIFFLVVGLFLWNRKTRRIELGNIMSRSRGRNGYSGRSLRSGLLRTGRKNNGIALDTHAVPDPLHSPAVHPDDYDEFHGEAGVMYRDSVPEHQHARRDSDGLGSLAASPVDATFQQQDATGGQGRNAFRDEMARQAEARKDEPRYL